MHVSERSEMLKNNGYIIFCGYNHHTGLYYYMQLFPTIHGNASLHSVTQHYTQILCTNTISFNKMFHEDFSYAMFIMQSNNVTGWMDGLIEVNDCFTFF